LDSDYASKEDVWISDTTAPPEVMAHFELGSGTGGSYAELRVLRAASQDQFGTSVAVDGDYVAVGALYHDHNGHSSAGSVYAFLRTGTPSWDAGTKIAAADPDAQDFLGISVAIDGQKLIAGEPAPTTRLRTPVTPTCFVARAQTVGIRARESFPLKARTAMSSVST
jgi:hypothetical protein